MRVTNVTDKKTMPEISRFYGIVKTMYFDEHNPPHFHARYGNEKVAVDIRALSVLEGKMMPRALGLTIEWAARHQRELLKNWDLARRNQTPCKIEPLQ